MGLEILVACLYIILCGDYSTCRPIVEVILQTDMFNL